MTSTAIDTSVVITTCSRAASLAGLLDSVLPQLEAAPFPVEMVLVDDGSTDNTAQVLQAFAARCTFPVLLLQGACRGVAAARNLGLQAARGRWVVTCDDDQLALPGWFAALHGAAEESNADAVGGPLVLHLPAPFHMEDYGPRARRLLGYADPTGNLRPYPVGHAPATSNVLMRADTIRALGGFDEQFTEGGEDADLFQRVAQAGGTLLYQPAACMLHLLTERRLTQSGLCWAAQRVGAGEARVKHHTGGRAALVLHCFKRVGVLFARDLPQLALSSARDDRPAARDALCSIWYTTGLLRAARALLHGKPQQSSRFLRHMDFRNRNGERSS